MALTLNDAGEQARFADLACPLLALVEAYALADAANDAVAGQDLQSVIEMEDRLERIERQIASQLANSLAGAFLQLQTTLAYVKQIEDWQQDGETSADLVQTHLGKVAKMLGSIYAVMARQVDVDALDVTARYLVRPDWIESQPGMPVGF